MKLTTAGRGFDVEMVQKIGASHDVAERGEKVRNCQQGDDLLGARSHVLEKDVREEDEEGAEAGERAGR